MMSAIRTVSRSLGWSGVAFAAMLVIALTVPGALRASSRDSATASSARRPPNIVMLMTDDQTAASLRFMPHVRALLVKNGVRFTNAFVTTPLCCPSRTTYFTGQYPHNHGVLFNHGPTGGYHVFHGRNTTFPEALRRAGYRTAHIGKYLNGFGESSSIPPGWNEFYGTVDPWTYNYYGFRLNHNRHIIRYAPTERNYNTDVFARTASSLIRRWAHRAPFFLNVAFVAPHSASKRDTTLTHEPDPIVPDPNEIDYRLAVPPLRYRGRFSRLPLPRPASFDELATANEPAFLKTQPLFRQFTPKDVVDIAARYHAQLESLLAVDDAVRRIVDTLRATGQLERTVIIFTSDNGFFNGEHRIRAGKYYGYDAATRVPLVVRGPGLPHGIVRSVNVANIDLAPTLLDLAHAHPLRPPDGISLRPVMLSPKVTPHRALLFETFPNSVYPVSYGAVRTGTFLYIRYSSADRELFDLRRDPDEVQNLTGLPGYASRQQGLDRMLQRLERCAGRTCQQVGGGG